MAEEESKIKKTIEESANNVEISICNILAGTDWKEVIENYYFPDPIEKKLREIDLIAVNNFSLDFGNKENHRIIFLIECKYIRDKIIFWFKNKKIEKAKTSIHKNYVFEKSSFGQDILGIDSQGTSHHYAKDSKVAKKWDYVKWDFLKNKSKECHDIIGKSINQLTNALYFCSRMSDNYKNKTSIFPILLISDYKNIFKVEESGSYSNISKSFQIEVEYSMKIDNHAVENFYQLIDVVRVSDFLSFINNFSASTLKVITRKLKVS